jgi:sulfhydrogenase subunit alpha
MPSRNVVIDTITKIEGNAGLRVIIEGEAVKDLQFIVADYWRFFAAAVRGRRIIAVPSFLSRICGTCSVAHLFASLMAIESAQRIAVTEQTRALRRLAYDGLMIRDHALHLYFFVLPDILGVDSILIFPMIQTIPATHSCTIPWISSGSAQTPENHTGR